MTKEEALNLALDALETSMYPQQKQLQAITAIKDIMAQPEPWEKFCDSNCVWTDHHPDCKLEQRTWVGLTDEEAFQICVDCGCLGADWLTLLYVIEAKLKEKNNG